MKVFGVSDRYKNTTMSVLQTVQKKKKSFILYIFILYKFTVHIYRMYRRQCAKYTYIYSVHSVL